MAIIKRITARGFKSFAYPTEMIFGPNFNCIIGPNGSGKSNCTDAVCFVLGKISAKDMRAERTSHLIYNGGKQGKPAREAEVTIEFDNSKKTFPIEGEIIKVTRVAKNNGTSVYKINSEVRTRQQVLELLNAAKIDPDGHNIILQGEINDFIEARPLEKRMIIEEIAGISAYEDKKLKCLQELEKVDAKLKEAGIILTEREANLRELKKERNEAMKYKDIQQAMQEDNATLIHLQIKDKDITAHAVEAKFKDANSKIEKTSKDIDSLKQQITGWRENIKKINQEIEVKGEKDHLLLRNDIENLKAEIIRASSRLETCRAEIQKINSKKQQLSADLRETDNKILELQKENIRADSRIKELNEQDDRVRKEIEQFKEKHGVDANSAKELETIEQQIEENQREISRIIEQKQDVVRTRDHIAFKMHSIEEKIGAASGNINTPETAELAEKKVGFKDVTARLNKHTSRDSEYAAELYKLRQEHQNNTEELSRLHAKNAGAQERISGDNATKKIIELKSKLHGIHGTVASLGKVNQKYSLALEIAAGPRIMSVVVDNDETAQKCIQYLKDNKFGVVTFLPLNKLKERNADEGVKAILKSKNKAVHGMAVDLVDFEPKYKTVFSYVFGDTLIVDSIDAARAIGIGRARMASVDGDLMESSGAMIGGYRQPRRAYGFAEKEIDSAIQIADEGIAKLQKTINNIEEKRTDNEAMIIQLRGEKATLEGAIIRIEKSISLPEKELRSLIGEQDALKNAASSEDGKIAEIQKTLDIIEKTISSLKNRKLTIKETLNNEGLMKNLEELEHDLAKIHENGIESKAELKTIVMQLESIYIPDKEKILKITKEQEKDYENFLKEIESLNEMLKGRNNSLKLKEKEEEKFHSNIKELAAKRDAVNEKIQGDDNEIARLEEKNRAQFQYSNDVSIERARIIAELEGLQKQFEPFKDTKIKRGQSIDQLRSQIAAAERDLAALGNVNMRAFEVYELIEKEYGALTEKANKLKTEKDDVFNLMAEIETRKKDIFMKTYDAISERFKSIFLSLSTKGEANLLLENPESPFEGGMDVEIKIAGNKNLDIKGLSGGEKTMAALAFIFAIQEYSPSPFYLLDEVDAALDRTNSALLGQLIKKYSSKAQYLVITHNDTIINDADLIYGVSMKEGISKVVGLKV